MSEFILEQSSRIQNTSELKRLVEEEIKGGRGKYFSYPGYPKFAYYEIDHPFLESHLGTAIRKDGSIDTSTSGQSRNPHDWYYIVFNGINRNQKAMCTIHEYIEIERQSHDEAALAEREFAEKFGMLQDFLGYRTKAARQSVRNIGLQRSYASYHDTIMRISSENGLTFEETESAVADIIAEHERKRS